MSRSSPLPTAKKQADQHSVTGTYTTLTGGNNSTRQTRSSPLPSPFRLALRVDFARPPPPSRSPPMHLARPASHALRGGLTSSTRGHPRLSQARPGLFSRQTQLVRQHPRLHTTGPGSLFAGREASRKRVRRHRRPKNGGRGETPSFGRRRDAQDKLDRKVLLSFPLFSRFEGSPSAAGDRGDPRRPGRTQEGGRKEGQTLQSCDLTTCGRCFLLPSSSIRSHLQQFTSTLSSLFTFRSSCSLPPPSSPSPPSRRFRPFPSPSSPSRPPSTSPSRLTPMLPSSPTRVRFF